MITIDITDIVKIKLTEYGREILRENERVNRIKYPALDYEFKLPEEDKEGWSEWSLATLITMFGGHILSSLRLPFNPEIQVDLDTK